jgi:hypothetical protein
MKEDDEGIPFHTLLTAGTHRGDRTSWRKITVAVLFRFCSGSYPGAWFCRGGAGQGQEGEAAGAHGAAEEQGAGARGEGSGGRLLAWLQET